VSCRARTTRRISCCEEAAGIAALGRLPDPRKPRRASYDRQRERRRRGAVLLTPDSVRKVCDLCPSLRLALPISAASGRINHGHPDHQYRCRVG
jgi:hypothetical protein